MGCARHYLALRAAMASCFAAGSSCGSNDEHYATATLESTTSEPLQCSPERGLLDVADVLSDPNDPCRPLIEPLHGRAVRVDRPGGSASIWSRRTAYGTGIMTTAAHVLSPCWRYWSDQDDQGAMGDGTCPQMFHDPKLVSGEAVVRLAAEGGGLPAPRWSAHFALYNPFVPPDQYTAPTGLPRYDVSMYAFDSQTFEAYGTGSGLVPEPIVDAPLELYDPSSHTVTVPTYAAVRGGELVLALGYPDLDGDSRRLHASVGRVLDADEAMQAIVTLREARDEEGQIAYDDEAEFLFEGSAAPGMSGGGVFDQDGRQVGIVVRASFADIGTQYVRAVRMSYLAPQMQHELAQLPDEQKSAITPYLETP